MSDKMSCPHCRQPLEIPKELSGQMVECPTCHGQITLPKTASPTIPTGSSIKRSVTNCRYCGQENDDGVVFCSHCGKSPAGIVLADCENPKTAVNWTTVGLIQDCFPWVFTVMFWLTVIGGMIGGVQVAQGLYALSNPYGKGGGDVIVVGGLIGLIIGFIIAVWSNGVVATLLEINKNLKCLADKEKTKA